MLQGTQLEIRFSRAVDGDTIRIFLPDTEKDVSTRILALDTEESIAGSHKPVTPWGKAAAERAKAFFQAAKTVTIEFPGNEDLETCLQKYRDNYGRLLVYVYGDGIDFQETMIREGYSPYFVKYGNAEFAGHHQRYIQAERTAQQQRRGIWDQIAVNGSVLRDYATLGVWWQLRASIIESYRQLRSQTNLSNNLPNNSPNRPILDSRLDYATLQTQAQTQKIVTVFTELRSISRVGGRSGLVSIGSVEQPFSLFLPDMDSVEGQAIVNLVALRYASDGETQLRRGYAYVTGQLSLFGDRPQMVLTSTEQISDHWIESNRETSPETHEEAGAEATLAIVSLLPNPRGRDAGQEQITLKNQGLAPVNLQGWSLKNRAGKTVELKGEIPAGESLVIMLKAGQMTLNNAGDDVSLRDRSGTLKSQVTYVAQEASEGKVIEFN
ncbi:MAG: hypothetical protein HC857_15690 [Synechococcales cyanobacterium RU_4_20]|nr:hypothetical protein [Synechococcales cyanobacterium RU_4_20]